MIFDQNIDIWTTAVWTTKTNRLKVFILLGLTEISEWRRQVNYVFVNVKPMNFFVCQAGAGNLKYNGRKGNKYHSAKAKNDRIFMVIMNNSFDLIESDPGNVHKYMEYMTMLDAAHEP